MVCTSLYDSNIVQYSDSLAYTPMPCYIHADILQSVFHNQIILNHIMKFSSNTTNRQIENTIYINCPSLF